jgi:hypothetical protein
MPRGWLIGSLRISKTIAVVKTSVETTEGARYFRYRVGTTDSSKKLKTKFEM